MYGNCTNMRCDGCCWSALILAECAHSFLQRPDPSKSPFQTIIENNMVIHSDVKYSVGVAFVLDSLRVSKIEFKIPMDVSKTSKIKVQAFDWD